MEATQIQYTVHNPYTSNIKLVIDSPNNKPALQLDLIAGGQVSFPMQVPEGYMVKISPIHTIKRKGDPRYKNNKLIQRFALVLDAH